MPEELLEERHRLGLDNHDEVWDGVRHMVPRPVTRTRGSDRGAEGAELVLEILSPNDETWQKLPWYVAREVLIIDPRDRVATLHRDGKPVEPVHSEILEVTFTTTGGALRVTGEDGKATL